MSKFEEMTVKELKAVIKEHRNDYDYYLAQNWLIIRLGKRSAILKIGAALTILTALIGLLN